MSKRAGDWKCPGCGDEQFARNATCRQCQTPKPGAHPDALEAKRQATDTKHGDWTCPDCHDRQFARNDTCRQCGAPRPWSDFVPLTAANAAAFLRGDTPPRKYYLAVDIEGRGDGFDNPITAIGLFFAPTKLPIGPDDVPSLKRRWALTPLEGQSDERRCIDEFWAKFPDVDAWIKGNAKEPRGVLLEVMETCRSLVEQAGMRNITIVTDCPDYDLGRIDNLLWLLRVRQKPFRFLGTNVCHSVNDPGQRLKQLNAEEGFKYWMREEHPTVKHSHYPDDDAEWCYYMQLFCDQRIPTLRT